MRRRGDRPYGVDDDICDGADEYEELRPLVADDEEADAHNDDTFGADAPVGDDWEPDHNACSNIFPCGPDQVHGPCPPYRTFDDNEKCPPLPEFFATGPDNGVLDELLEPLEHGGERSAAHGSPGPTILEPETMRQLEGLDVYCLKDRKNPELRESHGIPLHDSVVSSAKVLGHRCPTSRHDEPRLFPSSATQQLTSLIAMASRTQPISEEFPYQRNQEHMSSEPMQNQGRNAAVDISATKTQGLDSVWVPKRMALNDADEGVVMSMLNNAQVAAAACAALQAATHAEECSAASSQSRGDIAAATKAAAAAAAAAAVAGTSIPENRREYWWQTRGGPEISVANRSRRGVMTPVRDGPTGDYQRSLKEYSFQGSRQRLEVEPLGARQNVSPRRDEEDDGCRHPASPIRNAEADDARRRYGSRGHRHLQHQQHQRHQGPSGHQGNVLRHHRRDYSRGRDNRNKSHSDSQNVGPMRAVFPPPLFPLTQAHKSLIIEKKLPDASRWFKCRMEQSPGEANKTPEFMNNHDLDFILRVQLTQMAKRPELQRHTGRWNFKFLTKSTGGINSNLFSGVELERMLLEQENLPPELEAARRPDGVCVSTNVVHQLLLGSVAEELVEEHFRQQVAEQSSANESAIHGHEEEAEHDGEKSTGVSGSSHFDQHYHHKFGKTAYASVRHPRNMIHIVRETPFEGDTSSTSKDPDSTHSNDKPNNTEDIPLRDRARNLAYQLTHGGSDLTEPQRSLILKALVEDCLYSITSAQSFQIELDECPASHVTARTRLFRQQQHLLVQLYELLTLRHYCSAQPFPYSYLLDMSASANMAYSSHNSTSLRQQYFQQQPLQQAQQQTLLQTSRQKALEVLPVELKIAVEEGRRSTIWVLSRVCSSFKGQKLVTRLLPVLNDATGSALIQGLLCCGGAMANLCEEADAVISDSLAICGNRSDKDTSSVLFEELLRFTTSEKRDIEGTSFVSALNKGSPASRFYVQMIKKMVHVMRAAGAGRAVVACALVDCVLWDLKQSDASSLLSSDSGICLLAILAAHLPVPSQTTTPWQLTAAVYFLCQVAEYLVSSLALVPNQPVQQEQLMRKRPLIRSLLQQARSSPFWAAAITNRVTELGGEVQARNLLAAFVEIS